MRKKEKKESKLDDDNDDAKKTRLVVLKTPTVCVYTGYVFTIMHSLIHLVCDRINQWLSNYKPIYILKDIVFCIYKYIWLCVHGAIVKTQTYIYIKDTVLT